MAFNSTLSDTLARIRKTTRLLDDAQGAALSKDVLAALDKLEEAGKTLAGKSSLGSTTVSGLVQNRIKVLRDDLREETKRRWNALVSVHDSHSRIAIRDSIERKCKLLELGQMLMRHTK